MKRKFTALLLACLLLLPGCGAPSDGEDTFTIAASTYPVYLFATALTDGAEGVEVQLLINEQTSCLHDYTLTVRDMKLIEGADAIFLSGAGLEDFMSDALASARAAVLDCSAGVTLLEAEAHDHDHDHGADCENDPHYWLDPANAALMLQTMASWLTALEDGNAALYEANLAAALDELEALDLRCAQLSALDLAPLITFHDGFRYFAASCGLTLLRSIEEEEGSEASAAEMAQIISLIGEYSIPAIFTEVNGSDATAQAIARETGVQVAQLTMLMSGDGQGLQPYLDAMNTNYDAILAALGGQ